ncbi:MAG: hypothetical protein ACFFG0_18555 [Candidatus Thorarchaeota archaeon]
MDDSEAMEWERKTCILAVFCFLSLIALMFLFIIVMYFRGY